MREMVFHFLTLVVIACGCLFRYWLFSMSPNFDILDSLDCKKTRSYKSVLRQGLTEDVFGKDICKAMFFVLDAVEIHDDTKFCKAFLGVSAGEIARVGILSCTVPLSVLNRFLQDVKDISMPKLDAKRLNLIHMLAYRGHIPLLKHLVTVIPEALLQTVNDQTPFMMAVFGNQYEALELMVNTCKSSRFIWIFHKRDSAGMDLINHVISNGRIQMLHLLLKSGLFCPTGYISHQGYSMMQYSILTDQVAVFEYLTKVAPTLVFSKNIDGATVFDTLVKKIEQSKNSVKERKAILQFINVLINLLFEWDGNVNHKIIVLNRLWLRNRSAFLDILCESESSYYDGEMCITIQERLEIDYIPTRRLPKANKSQAAAFEEFRKRFKYANISEMLNQYEISHTSMEKLISHLLLKREYDTLESIIIDPTLHGYSIYDGLFQPSNLPKNGKVPLIHFAVAQNDTNLFELILKKDSRMLYYKDNEGRTVLHIAVETRNFAFIEVALAKIEDQVVKRWFMDLQDKRKAAFWQTLAYEHQYEVLDRLLELNLLSLRSQTEDGTSLLQHVALSGTMAAESHKFIEKFSFSNLDVVRYGSNGLTLMHYVIDYTEDLLFEEWMINFIFKTYSCALCVYDLNGRAPYNSGNEVMKTLDFQCNDLQVFGWVQFLNERYNTCEVVKYKPFDVLKKLDESYDYYVLKKRLEEKEEESTHISKRRVRGNVAQRQKTSADAIEGLKSNDILVEERPIPLEGEKVNVKATESKKVKKKKSEPQILAEPFLKIVESKVIEDKFEDIYLMIGEMKRTFTTADYKKIVYNVLQLHSDEKIKTKRMLELFEEIDELYGVRYQPILLDRVSIVLRSIPSWAKPHHYNALRLNESAIEGITYNSEILGDLYSFTLTNSVKGKRYISFLMILLELVETAKVNVENFISLTFSLYSKQFECYPSSEIVELYLFLLSKFRFSEQSIPMSYVKNIHSDLIMFYDYSRTSSECRRAIKTLVGYTKPIVLHLEKIRSFESFFDCEIDVTKAKPIYESDSQSDDESIEIILKQESPVKQNIEYLFERIQPGMNISETAKNILRKHRWDIVILREPEPLLLPRQFLDYCHGKNVQAKETILLLKSLFRHIRFLMLYGEDFFDTLSRTATNRSDPHQNYYIELLVYSYLYRIIGVTKLKETLCELQDKRDYIIEMLDTFTK
jgi:ankyrin repeat protein